MKIIDDAVLAEFRAGPCERCRRPGPCDPHHCFITRGVGGGTRLDMRQNLLSLCFQCHHYCHNVPGVNAECRRIIAKREGSTVEAIENYLWLVLRTDKNQPLPAWSEAA